MRQSMSRAGDCYDNAFMESCFGTIKTELQMTEYESQGHSDESSLNISTTTTPIANTPASAPNAGAIRIQSARPKIKLHRARIPVTTSQCSAGKS